MCVPIGTAQRRHPHALGDHVAPLVAHPVHQDLVVGHPVQVHREVLAVAGDDPVRPADHRHRRPGRVRLLPLVLRIGAHPPRPLELEGDLVELPADPHLLVRLDHLLIGQGVFRELLVELAVLVEDLQILDLGLVDRLNRHRLSRMVGFGSS
jgi:hypothetical protein